MPTVDIVDALAAWARQEAEAVRDPDLEITFDRTRDDRPKHSAWVGLDCRGRLGALIVWSTGEAEYMTGAESGPVVDEHHEIESVEQLHALLDRLIGAVMTPPGQTAAAM